MKKELPDLLHSLGSTHAFGMCPEMNVSHFIGGEGSGLMVASYSNQLFSYSIVCNHFLTSSACKGPLENRLEMICRNVWWFPWCPSWDASRCESEKLLPWRPQGRFITSHN